MNNLIRVVLGLTLVSIGFFWDSILERIPDMSPDETPVVEINQPNEETLGKVLTIASLVTDQDDKVRLGIFNKVFSERVVSYNAEAQQVNDIYTQAGKNVFQDSMKGKYEGYGEGLNSLMMSTLGTENHIVTDAEKTKVAKDFSALAYALIQ